MGCLTMQGPLYFLQLTLIVQFYVIQTYSVLCEPLTQLAVKRKVFMVVICYISSTNNTTLSWLYIPLRACLEYVGCLGVLTANESCVVMCK